MSDLTIKELLEIATDGEVQEQEETPKSKLHFSLREFITRFQVQHSQERVTSEFLFYVYRFIYKEGIKYKKLSKVEFCRQLSTLFERARTGTRRYFLVKLTLTEKELAATKELVDLRKTYVRQRKEKSKQKKRNQISLLEKKSKFKTS